MHSLSSRLLFLTVSLAAHAGLYLAVGNAASAGGTQAAPQEKMTITTVALASAPAALEPAAPDNETAREASAPSPQESAQPSAPEKDIAGTATPPASEGAGGNASDGAALPVLMSAEPHYFDLSELTQQPALERDITPGSMVAMPNDVPRSLVLTLLINEQGGIDDVEFEGVTLPELVQHLVTDLFSALKFHPGKRDDVAVKSRMQIEVSLQDILPVDQASRMAGSLSPAQ